MELLLVEETTLASKFYTLELVGFIACFVTYIIVRMTRAHSAGSALKVMFTLFVVLSWVGYSSYTSNWYKIEMTDQTLKLYFPKSNPSNIPKSAIETIRPRYGKNGCSIVIRTDKETLKSAEFAAKQCKETSASLNAALVNAHSLL